MLPKTPDGAPVRIPLTQLKRGQRAIVDCSALSELPDRERCLLAAMGMADQCKVKVCKGGSPCIIQVDTTRIGLSKELASKIIVTICDGQ